MRVFNKGSRKTTMKPEEIKKLEEEYTSVLKELKTATGLKFIRLESRKISIKRILSRESENNSYKTV